MQDNKYLKLWQFIVLDIFEIKSVKYYLIFLTFYFIVFLLLQTYSFVHKASVSYFVQFGPTYFIIVYLILCTLSLHFSSHVVISSTQVMRSWKIHVHEKWETEYNQELFIVTVYMVVTLCLGMVTAFFYFLPTKQDRQFFFENSVAEMYFPKCQDLIIWFSKVGFFPLTYISMVQPLLRIIYCWMHVKLHIYNCLFFLKDIDNGDDCEIGKRLKFCFQYYIQIAQLFRNILSSTQIYVWPFQIVGTFLIANVVIYYFWFEDVLTDQYLRIFSLGISAFVILFGLAKSGQAIEDTSDNIVDVLFNFDWWNWNESNKKMYLMFLVSAQRQFKMKYSENISLNYEMGVEILKTFFSTISVMVKLQK